MKKFKNRIYFPPKINCFCTHSMQWKLKCIEKYISHIESLFVKFRVNYNVRAKKSLVGRLHVKFRNKIKCFTKFSRNKINKCWNSFIFFGILLFIWEFTFFWTSASQVSNKFCFCTENFSSKFFLRETVNSFCKVVKNN